jgi:hypothetical protein
MSALRPNSLEVDDFQQMGEQQSDCDVGETHGGIAKLGDEDVINGGEELRFEGTVQLGHEISSDMLKAYCLFVSVIWAAVATARWMGAAPGCSGMMEATPVSVR